MLKSRYSNSIIMLVASHFLMDLLLGVWPIYKTLVGLDLKMASMIAGVCLVVGEAAQLIFGILGTRYSSRLLILAGLTMTIGVSLLSHTNSYFLLFLIILSLYLGSGAFHPAAAGLVGSLSEKPRGMLLTLFYCGGTLGAALSQMAFAGAWHSFGGETLIFAIPVILLFFVLCYHTFPSENDHKSSASIKEICCQLLQKKSVLGPLFTAQVIMQSLVVAIMFLLPDLLMDRGSASWLVYGGGDFFFVIGAAVLGLCGGYLADRYSWPKVLLVSSAGSLLGLYLFLLSPSGSSASTSCVLFAMGGMMGIAPPLLLSAAQEKVAPHLRSLTSGIFMGGATCFAGLGVFFSGLMTDFFYHDPLVKSLAIMGCFIVIVFGIASRFVRSDSSAAALTEPVSA